MNPAGPPFAFGRSAFGVGAFGEQTLLPMSLQPQNLVLVVNGQSSVTLTWTPIMSSVVVGYNIWRDGRVLNASPITSATYTDSAVIAGRHYNYAVSAVDALGNESVQTPMQRADVLQGNTLTFESVYQQQPGEGGYPDILWRWQ